MATPTIPIHEERSSVLTQFSVKATYVCVKPTYAHIVKYTVSTLYRFPVTAKNITRLKKRKQKMSPSKNVTKLE